MPQPTVTEPRSGGALARVTGFLLFAQALRLEPDKLTAALLRAARGFEHISQQQLAKTLGLPVFRVWSFENGVAEPSPAEWTRLAETLDLLKAVERAARTLEDTSP